MIDAITTYFRPPAWQQLAIWLLGGAILASGGCSSGQASRNDGKGTPTANSASSNNTDATDKTNTTIENTNTGTQATMKYATFGAGCFWCVEAVFQQLEGVEKVESGYTGGQTVNPTYDQICSGRTGHAEVCRITYDPKKITFPELLEVFWKTHDPTTLNRQGADSGTQYRSAVFYHDAEQQKLAKEYKDKLDKSEAFNSPIVTEITMASEFYKAEGHHQNFYKDNPTNGYCRAVIIPKMAKFRAVFKDKLRADAK